MRKITLLPLLMLVLAACGTPSSSTTTSTPTSTPTSTVTSTPTSTPTSTVTSTPTSTATSTPTSTTTSTSTSTSTSSEAVIPDVIVPGRNLFRDKVVDDLDNNIYPEKEEVQLPKYVSLVNMRGKPHLVFEKKVEDK